MLRGLQAGPLDELRNRSLQVLEARLVCPRTSDHDDIPAIFNVEIASDGTKPPPHLVAYHGFPHSLANNEAKPRVRQVVSSNSNRKIGARPGPSGSVGSLKIAAAAQPPMLR